MSRLLEGERLRRLTKLALTRTVQTESLLRAVVGSALLPRLTALRLAQGDIRSAAEVVEAASACAHLALLDLSSNELTHLPGDLGEHVVTTGQRSPAEFALSANSLAQLCESSATLAKARGLATANSWPQLGRDGEVFWGRCAGSELGPLTRAAMLTTCTCVASFQQSVRQTGNSCKHGVDLAMLASSGQAFAPTRRPPGFSSSAATSSDTA